MKKEDLDKIVVIQSKDLNDAFYKNSYTLLEKKLILKLISEFNKTQHRSGINSIDLSEFVFFNDLVKNKKHKYIHHNICRGVASKTLMFDGLWSHWFYSIGCKDGKIFYEFDIRVKEELLVDINKNYNEFFLSNILDLDIYYSIRIYEILSLMVKWKTTKEIYYRRVSWEDFKKFLNIEKSGYRSYDIKSKIIEKVKKEIELKTDIKFNYTINKKNNKYDYIDFVIMKNTK